MKSQWTRRDFLKLLLSTPIAATLDVEKLLWIPEKTIFILPARLYLSVSQIMAIELERIVPHIRELFERDDTFYRIMSK